MSVSRIPARGSVRHNHELEPFAPLRAPGECPRCDVRRAERAARGLVDHNHVVLPYGRRLAYGQCPRCDQLHNGAVPRPGRGWRDEQELRRAQQAHFAAGGPHDRGVCGPVCTAFDW